ncbi:MAG: tetratricopeptide repeat protein [Gemmatimonadetes bacterium]|nr:tetratricopeptide repeat protein [Gemmatimonadota bacterium]
MRKTSSILLAFACVVFGCAYYNTFYNAKKAFKEGERIRLNQQTPDGSIHPMAVDSYELAIENAGLVLRDHPGSSLVDDALVLIGDARAIQGQHLQAIKRYEQVLRLFPDSEFVAHCLFSLGRSHFEAGNPVQADELLDRFIREYPGSDQSPDAFLLSGEIAFDGGRYEEAVTRFEVFLTTYPGNDREAEALFYIARSSLEMNRFEGARDLFARVIGQARTKTLRYRAGFMTGESLRREGEHDAALEVFESLLEQRDYARYRPEVMLAMAECQAGLGGVEGAVSRYVTIISEFETDRDYDEEVSQAMYELAELYRNTGRLEYAERHYADALRKSPREYWVGKEAESKNFAIRELRRLNGNLDNLLNALAATKARENDGPNHASNVARLTENVAGIRFQLAEHYLFQLDMADSALSRYRSIENESGDPSLAAKAAFARAWVLDEVMDDPARANAVYDTIAERYAGTDHAVEAAIIRSKPIEGELPEERLFSEAERLLFEADRPDSARGLYEQVLHRYPDGEFAPRALYALGWLAETRFGDPETALKRYRDIVGRYPGSDQAKSVHDKIRLMEELRQDTGPDK